MSDLVAEGRAAHAARAWTLAFERLDAARHDGALPGDDLDRLAEAAYLVGRDADTGRAWQDAHRAHLDDGDHEAAARSAFWLGLWHLLRGEGALAAGWLARARGIVDDAGVDGPARGFLHMTASMEALAGGDHARAVALADAAAALGQRCGDRDLWSLGSLTRGEALISAGDVAAGMAVLDEVMVAATVGELSPIPTGIVYCAVIDACVHAYDLVRAAEWTRALSRWCEEQPDLVPFRGHCLVHRAQVFHARGDWERAATEAAGAERLLTDPPHPARAAAALVLGELHRLRGSFDAAGAAYRQAATLGHPPMPGLALLRLAQGRLDDATGGIRRALAETVGGLGRPALLAAAVEIFVAADDVAAARSAADELDTRAADDAPAVLRAMAAHARGTTALAAGDPTAALRALRRACTRWHDLDMPYEEARARAALADVCQALGDTDGADAERGAARHVFERLGATPDLRRLDRRHAADAGLSAREHDVLEQVASGRTNREVGHALGISEHTVARHLQNIFAKLGVSSRAAAVAAALERRPR